MTVLVGRKSGQCLQMPSSLRTFFSLCRDNRVNQRLFVFIYRKIPIISPGLVVVQKAFSEACFREGLSSGKEEGEAVTEEILRFKRTDLN